MNKIAIISTQNHIGIQADKRYNDEAMVKLLNNLKNGCYRYFVTDVLYDSPEKSVMVYNISLEDGKFLCYKYNQESMIFVDMTNGNDVTYEYWEGGDKQT